MPNWKTTVVAGALVLATAGLTLAAGNGWWGRGSGWDMGHMTGAWRAPGMMMGYYWADDALDHIEGRLAFLETELKITEEQASAWKALADVIRATARTHTEAMQEMMTTPQDDGFWDRPLPDRLAFQQVHMEARLDEIKMIGEAVDKFYAVLSDEQKEIADEIVLPAMGMGVMGWGDSGPGMMWR